MVVGLVRTYLYISQHPFVPALILLVVYIVNECYITNALLLYLQLVKTGTTTA